MSLDFLYENNYYKAIAFRITKNWQDAEDAVQDAAMKLFYYYSNKSESQLKAIAIEVIRNACIDKYRKKVRRRNKDADVFLNYNEVTPSFENAFIAKEALKEIWIKIAMLPENRQEDLMMVVNGHTHETIRKRGNRTIGTVLFTIRQDRKFLKGERVKPLIESEAIKAGRKKLAA